MPHKINPIHFENAEGNFLLANVLLQFFSQQFQLSRMQRDLVNSTLWRNVGVAFGHTLLAIKNLQEGTTRITPNYIGLAKDLENHYEVLSEPMQILLKSMGEINAYETVKAQFRGVGSLSQQQWLQIVETLQCNNANDVLKTLRELTPSSYALLGHTVKKI
jgi:adenylosuccinate lyase